MGAAGAIIGDIDVAQLLLVAFVIFFFGLVLHLRTEDKREGFPLVETLAGEGEVEGFPPIPKPKVFLLMQGGATTAPHGEFEPAPAARRAFPFIGSPIDPIGDPLTDCIGPAAYAMRSTEPLWFSPGVMQMAPLRTLEGWSLADGDVDPRGMPVGDIYGATAGVVRDLWIDRGVKILRYLEVEADDGVRTLLPIHHTDIRRIQARVVLKAVRAGEVARAPRLAAPDVVTAREEDQINAFYAGARFYANETTGRPPRLAPWERRRRTETAS